MIFQTTLRIKKDLEVSLNGLSSLVRFKEDYVTYIIADEYTIAYHYAKKFNEEHDDALIMMSEMAAIEYNSINIKSSALINDIYVVKYKSDNCNEELIAHPRKAEDFIDLVTKSNEVISVSLFTADCIILDATK